MMGAGIVFVDQYDEMVLGLGWLHRFPSPSSF